MRKLIKTDKLCERKSRIMKEIKPGDLPDLIFDFQKTRNYIINTHSYNRTDKLQDIKAKINVC